MVSRTPTKPPAPAPLMPRSGNTGSPAKPTPSPVSSRRRRLLRVPAVASAAKRGSPPVGIKSLAASFDTTLRGCRRRLLKLFSRLALLRSPSKRRAAAAAGFRRLRSPSSSPPPPKPSQVASVPLPLPPPADPARRTLFLDLDETLIHSQTDPPAGHRHDFAVRPVIGGQAITFYVAKRPGVDAFLSAAARLFELVVFTAGLPEYASLVLDRLDPAGELFAHRLYRGACRDVAGDGRLVKDLGATGRELGRAVIVDDNPNAYALQPDNAVPVAPFIDDAGDRELERVMGILAVAAEFDDTRKAIKHYKDLVEAS